MNASLSDLFSQIESVEFDADMSIFSGFNSFRDALEKEAVVEKLIETLRDAPENQRAVLHRLLELLTKNDELVVHHRRD